jgi:LysR family transcriptional regulator, low CO2-responsive transcriptional regulator
MFPATFRRLQVFLAVAEAGSFVGGAQKLGISRPSVSQHMRALERDVGFALFNRHRGASSGLTARGRRLYETGVDILERAEQLSQELSGDFSPTQLRRRRQLRVAAHRFILNEVLKTPFADFAREHPDIELLLEAGSYGEVINALRDGTIDLGFFIAAGEKIEVPTEIVGSQPVGFYVAPSHALAQRTRIEAGELSRYPFVSARKDSRSGLMLERMLTPLGVVDFPIFCRTTEDDISREFAIAGLAIAICFARSVAADVSAGRLVELPFPKPRLEIELHQAFNPWRRTDRATRQLAMYLKRNRAFG